MVFLLVVSICASLLEYADLDRKRRALEPLNIDRVLILCNQVRPPSHELIALLIFFIVAVL